MSVTLVLEARGRGDRRISGDYWSAIRAHYWVLGSARDPDSRIKNKIKVASDRERNLTLTSGLRTPVLVCAYIPHTIQTHTHNEIKVRKLSSNGQKTKIVSYLREKALAVERTKGRVQYKSSHVLGTPSHTETGGIFSFLDTLLPAVQKLNIAWSRYLGCPSEKKD